jgi:putative ABC transport system permease protein
MRHEARAGARGMSTLAMAIRIARRELRGGVRGLRIVLACLALGVAAIAAVGTLTAAVQAGLAADGRKILGGDLEVSASSRPVPPEMLAHMRARGDVAEVAEMRAMLVALDAAGRPGERVLVELKAADRLWPLYGEAFADGTTPVQTALAPRENIPGVLLERVLLDRLGVQPGSRVRLGEAIFRVAGVLTTEPDRVATPAVLGARALIAFEALPATQLVQPGSLLRFEARWRLPEGSDIAAAARGLRAVYPDGGIRIRDASRAAPGVEGFVGRTELFLTLVGLTTLLVGGIGVANGVTAWLTARRRSIATLKCLGAPARVIFVAYAMQLAALSLVGIAIGLVVGAVLPFILAGIIGDALPVPPRFGLYPGPLALAALYGVLCAACFALWPLARAREIPAIALFRDGIVASHARPRLPWIVANAALALGLAGLVIATAQDRNFAAAFCAGAAATLVVFRLGAIGLQAAARAAPRSASLPVRLGLANLHRPGSPAPLMLISLGLGLSTLAAVALIQGNIGREITGRMAVSAPSFFFVDIQPDQVERFDQLVGSDGMVQRVPSLRARIVAIKGIPVEQAPVAEEARWAVRGDRGLTYAATPPPGTELVAGQWWARDYSGAPLVSFDANIARGFGLGLGDTVTVNVLGRDIDLQVANLRRIDWRSLGMNFTLVVSPGLLERAPHTFIATVAVPEPREAGLLRAVTDALPNVSAIRVRDALEAVAALVARLGAALTATGGVALGAGALVLAGAVAAGQARRIRDSVVLKTLGASRAQIRKTFLVEFTAIGLTAGLLAALIGTAAAWGVTTYVMRSEFVFLPATLGGTIVACALLTAVFGWVGTGAALRARPAPLLRNE